MKHEILAKIAELQAERERLAGWEGVVASPSVLKFLKTEFGRLAQKAREDYVKIDARRDTASLELVMLQAEERTYSSILSTIKDLHEMIKSVDFELSRLNTQLQSIDESEPALRG